MATGLEELGISDDDAERAVWKEAEAPARDREAPQPTPRSRGIPVILLEQPVSEPHEGSGTDALTTWLSRIPLLSGMHPRHIARIAALAIDERYGAGDSIYRAGETGGDLFIVVEGTVRMIRTIGQLGEEALAILRAGHHFGELSFLEGDGRRLSDARVQHRARVLRLRKDDLRDLMFVDRDLAHDLLWRFVAGLTRQVREASDRLAMFAGSIRF
ncbi:MAG: cyclic nucleotide-binding domain-containing protein [Myxococcales bacterium]|nr:cyclic nucleotide-binding domain-containing protein [Myxococcales bacterium]